MINPVACPNEITKRPTTSATIASICFLPSPKILDFCRMAKTIVNTSKKGRMVSTNIG